MIYSLKNARSARIGGFVVLDAYLVGHCAPTLAGLKTANLFTCTVAGDLRGTLAIWNEALLEKGVRLLALRVRAQTALIYVYRRVRQRDLQRGARQRRRGRLRSARQGARRISKAKIKRTAAASTAGCPLFFVKRIALTDYIDSGTVMLNIVRTLRMTVAVARQSARRACIRPSASPLTRQAL